jgi:hypothetical protein
MDLMGAPLTNSCRRPRYQESDALLSLPFYLGVAGMIPTARIERSLLLPLAHLVRVSEVIPTAAVERPLSEVGVPGAKESPH